MVAATIEMHLADPGFLAFKGKVLCRVLVDGDPVAQLRIGETRAAPVPAGLHSVHLALEFGRITRRSNRLKLDVADGETVRMTATYSRLWGKYRIAVAA